MMKRNRRKFVVLTAIALLFSVWIFWIRWRPAQRFEFSPVSENEIRVLTWNVGYFSAVKNKNLRDVDLKPILGLLREIGADIIILQELGAIDQTEAILEDLGELWEAHSVTTGHGSQVLSVVTRLDSRVVEKLECGGRKVIAASLLSRGEDSIYVVGVHSPHPARGIDATVESIRCALSLAKNRDERVRIVAGDMNYNFDPETNKSSFYNEILDFYGDGTVGLGETYYAHTRIDQVFHYPKDLSVVQSSSGLLDLPLRFAKVPGFRDHRPIVVTYDLGNE